MKKILIICILIVSVIFISGCTSDEQASSDVSTSSQSNQESDSKKNELNKLETFIDPELKNIKIEKSDPDIEVVRLELIDDRDYKESEKYSTKLLLSNNGNQQVFINANLRYVNQGWNAPRDYYTLNSGERMWFSFGYGGETLGKVHTLDKLTAFVITSHKIITPYISPELKNLDSFSFGRVDPWSQNPAPFVDVHSIKYEIKDESHGWKSIVIEASTDGNKNGGYAGFGLIGSNGELLKYDDGTYVNAEKFISPGKTEIIEIPLRKFTADDIYGVGMGSRAPPI